MLRTDDTYLKLDPLIRRRDMETPQEVPKIIAECPLRSRKKSLKLTEKTLIFGDYTISIRDVRKFELTESNYLGGILVIFIGILIISGGVCLFYFTRGWIFSLIASDSGNDMIKTVLDGMVTFFKMIPSLILVGAGFSVLIAGLKHPSMGSFELVIRGNKEFELNYPRKELETARKFAQKFLDQYNRITGK
jgi:hypothetical protein